MLCELASRAPHLPFIFVHIDWSDIAVILRDSADSTPLLAEHDQSLVIKT